MFPLVSTAYACTVLVPGVSVTPAVQFVQPLVVVTAVHPDPFNEQYTAPTATLSPALPTTVNVPLVHCWFDDGLTMLTDGFCTSTKFAVYIRFGCIVNRNVAPLVNTLLEPSVQFVNPNPKFVTALAVIV